MAKALTPSPKFTVYLNGAPASGALVYTYEGGTEDTPIVTYSDYDGTENSNPVECDTRGEADIWLTPGVFYKFVVTTADDVMIYTVDDISTVGEGSATFTDVTTENLTVTDSSNLLPYLAFKIVPDDTEAIVGDFDSIPIFPCEIIGFKLFCATQSSSGSVEVDCLYFDNNSEGDSIFTTLPTIAVNTDFSADGELDPTKTTVTDWTKFKAVITDAGTDTTGVTLILYVRPSAFVP